MRSCRVHGSSARTRISRYVATAILVISALIGPNPWQAPGVAQVVDREPILEPCELAPPGGQPLPGPTLCGWYPVPEDRENPDGRWIRLRVAVIKSTVADPEPDPMVMLFGGPGQAAASFAPFMGPGHRTIFPRRDLVLVDQRGTGESNGLLCPTDLTEDRVVEDVFAQIFGTEEFQACRRLLASGADLSKYHTTIAAHDLAEVLDWLGYGLVNIEGGSYGTRMAQVFMRLYPERIRTATLDGVVPMNALSPAPYSLGTTDSFFRLMAKCEADERCAAAYPNVTAAAEAILQRLDEGRVRGTVSDPRDASQKDVEISKAIVGYAIRGMLYSPRLFPDLPGMVHTAHSKGDFSSFADRFIQRQIAFADGTFATGMYFSVFCTEDVPWIGEEEVEANRGTIMDDTMIKEYRAACEGWPRSELPENFHAPVSIDAPTLLFSGEFDPSTTAADGSLVAASLPNALHLVIPGGGHGRMSNPNAGRCTGRISVEFIQRGTFKGIDTSCIKEIQPQAFTLPGG